MIPDEIILWFSVLVQFLPVLALVWIGMLVADIEADKKKIKDTGDPEAYVISWKMFALYGILGSVFAMAAMSSLLEDFLSNFWFTMCIAGGMGLTFRSLLPELQEIIAVKIKSVLQAIFK